MMCSSDSVDVNFREKWYTFDEDVGRWLVEIVIQRRKWSKLKSIWR